MSIRRLHWALVPPDFGPLTDGGPLFALWPEPVPDDACFHEAGFREFDDGDDEWDRDFEALVERLLQSLRVCGEPGLLAGDFPVRESGPSGTRRRETGTIHDAPVCAATDDQFAPCWVGFGVPPSSHVLTSDGHPLLWVYSGRNVSIESCLGDVAGPLATVETSLDWSVLALRPERVSTDRR